MLCHDRYRLNHFRDILSDLWRVVVRDLLQASLWRQLRRHLLRCELHHFHDFLVVLWQGMPTVCSAKSAGLGWTGTSTIRSAGMVCATSECASNPDKHYLVDVFLRLLRESRLCVTLRVYVMIRLRIREEKFVVFCRTRLQVVFKAVKTSVDLGNCLRRSSGCLFKL